MTSDRVPIAVATVTLKAADEVKLALFWRQLLGYVEVGHDSASVRLEDVVGNGPTVLIQPSDADAAHDAEERYGKLHLDLRAENHQAAVHWALQLGAAHCDVGQDGTEPWTVLADPEGNEFCILMPLDYRGDNVC